jgi:copper homeostasis protein
MQFTRWDQVFCGSIATNPPKGGPEYESMSDPVLLEVCVDSVESALAAEKGGAHRIELCSDLLEGGITPSAGLIASVRRRISIGVHVMIRPRDGDFCYSAEEFEAMDQDGGMAKQLGADGIVIGILKEDGHVDTRRTRLLVEIARPLKVTFHRAFDMSVDLNQALEDIIETGADRLLTSGGQQTVEDGMTTVARLVDAARDRIVSMAGGGISKRNVLRIITQTGVREIHAGLRTTVPSKMQHRNEKVSMGTIQGHEYQRAVVLEHSVREILLAALAANSPT